MVVCTCLCYVDLWLSKVFIHKQVARPSQSKGFIMANAFGCISCVKRYFVLSMSKVLWSEKWTT